MDQHWSSWFFKLICEEKQGVFLTDLLTAGWLLFYFIVLNYSAVFQQTWTSSTHDMQQESA